MDAAADECIVLVEIHCTTPVACTGASDGSKTYTVKCTTPEGASAELSYTDVKVIGNGSFGVVYKVWER
jgi:hypothetical protein